MICLDTNYFIRGLVEGSDEASRLEQWVDSGETLVTSGIVWYEFRCGPVSARQIEVMHSFLHGIIPFTELEAEVAARLFQHAGRKRALKVDAMIAATALVAKASLATRNVTDFERFPGVKLV